MVLLIGIYSIHLLAMVKEVEGVEDRISMPKYFKMLVSDALRVFWIPISSSKNA